VRAFGSAGLLLRSAIARNSAQVVTPNRPIISLALIDPLLLLPLLQVKIALLQTLNSKSAPIPPLHLASPLAFLLPASLPLARFALKGLDGVGTSL